MQKFLHKERNLHLIYSNSENLSDKSIDQFDESILSDDQKDIQNFMQAYEKREKYEISNNAIN